MLQGGGEVAAPCHGPAAAGQSSELDTDLSPTTAASQDPVPQPTSSLSPNSPCPPHHSRAAETTTGPVSRGGRGQWSAGEGNGGGGRLYPRARAPAPAPKTPPQPLPTPPHFPMSPRQPHQELRLGGRPGVRGRGALTSQSIQPHMPHAGRGHSQLGSPAWVSPTGKPPGSDWGLQGDRASPTPP